MRKLSCNVEGVVRNLKKLMFLLEFKCRFSLLTVVLRIVARQFWKHRLFAAVRFRVRFLDMAGIKHPLVRKQTQVKRTEAFGAETPSSDTTVGATTA